MQQNPTQPPGIEPRVPDVPSAADRIPADDPTSSSLFNWSDFLDFNLDENFHISFPQTEPEQPGIEESQPSDNSGLEKPGRVRKRDPRLVCSNFLAGRVPCACPELDEKLEAEESALPGKKRSRMLRASSGGPARCQVPGCEVDISELKGYHKRHRVCLRCAHASTVELDGESKRHIVKVKIVAHMVCTGDDFCLDDVMLWFYLGCLTIAIYRGAYKLNLITRFHILSDFDEGKRSCRRKLERHNNRRRRKPNDSKEGMQKESQQTILVDDVSGDDDTGKDGVCVSSQLEEREMLLESDGHFSTLCSALGSHNPQSDSVVSFPAFDETHIVGDRQNPRYKRSPSDCENKSTFSSVCPAGRISFKLYDWNPAEFPRRLRHQIFQWLASMPIELEGYIRPGCTILTAFIAMPKPVWLKLLAEPALCIKDLVASPGSMLSGRGTMHVYLNDMIFRVSKDASSVVKVKMKDRAPKLHYIYPTCFEAGRPMELVACGSYLLQPNFRFLISFAGRYLAYNICVSSCYEKGDVNSSDHQLLKIFVPQINMDLFGPAFIEVENQSGLSNFIPILVGDKGTCAEMEMLQHKFDAPVSSQERKSSPSRTSCEAFASRQTQFSEFVLDVAWLLKKPVSEQQLTSSHIQRFNCLLNFLIEKESSVVLERVFCSLKSAIDNNMATGTSDSNMRLLRKNMDIAQLRLAHKLLVKDISVIPAGDGKFYRHSSQNDTVSVVPAVGQVVQRMVKNMLGLNTPSPSPDESLTLPLIKREVIMDVNHHEMLGSSSSRLLARTFSTSRLLIMAIAAIGVCFGICSIVLHPQRVDLIVTTIQRCLFDNT
ncbi:Squamosa promoter-binding-like protein 7 [Sesamum angolense]|uniref:Squamosa promoter-binding-like protein 7 n=1 Tax=Sesamum angolense TaxID=2727404 RepID=A0AAE1W856_9LAMI|nr:Squamosa promoter-binding-like protein 7 [Sesamum angolense]